MLSEHEQSLLCKGLNFAIPQKKLIYANYILPFELLTRDIKGVEISGEDLNFIRARLKDTALSTFKNYNNNKPRSNLSKLELEALNNLIKNHDLIIQKADKGNAVVVLNKEDILLV